MATGRDWETMDREWKDIAPLNGGLNVTVGAGEADQTDPNAQLTQFG